MIARKTSVVPYLAGAVLGFATWAGTAGAQQGPATGQKAATGDPAMDQNVVAVVNGEIITRQQLAEELIARKGRSQLDALVNRTLIEQTAKSKGITVTDKEIQNELMNQVRISASGTVMEFERSVLRAQKTNLLEYREDVIRPKLLIQKLAEARLQVSDQDLQREFASQYGEKVVCRIITFKDVRVANKVWAEIGGNPQNFIRNAKMQEDIHLAASAGMLKPFGRHTTHDLIEKRAFEMKEGEVSEVIQTPQGAYVIVMTEHHLPARTDVTYEQKREEIRQAALERKRKEEVPKIVAELRDQAKDKIKIYYGNELQRALDRASSVFEEKKQ